MKIYNSCHLIYLSILYDLRQKIKLKEKLLLQEQLLEG